MFGAETRMRRVPFVNRRLTATKRILFNSEERVPDLGLGSIKVGRLLLKALW